MSEEKLSFQADVSKVLDIVVNSLYSHNEIFLRELISNAADACDKLRYAALTHPGLAKGRSFQIDLIPNKEKHELTVQDNGIGMDKEDLIHHLGTIAHSGSAEFIRNLTGDSQKDINLIGQFGVGFYSAFMVADKVTVLTKKAGDNQGWRWESDGKGTFTLNEDDKAPDGTAVILHLKKGFEEYTDPIRLRTIIRQYSDHISIPIVLDVKGSKETINTASALWMRPKADITEEQYRDFYRHLTHAFDDPWMTVHYKAEGVIEYTGLLFIPGAPPVNLFQPDQKETLNLYVNKVFISNEVEELLPHFLRFVRGVIDTTELPLNVSREMLQHTPVLTKIKKGIVKRLLTELKKRAQDAKAYETFWNNFGIVFKEGLYEDREHEKEIADLCRFRSTKGEELVSFAEYVARMPKEQKNIYYLTGDDLSVLRNNPQLEGFTARGIEVLLLTDPIDEFWPQVYMNYDGKPIKSVTHPDTDIHDIKIIEEASGEPMDAALQKVLIEKVKELLKGEITDVTVTDRLHKSPVALVAGAGQMSIHLERLMKMHGQPQAFASHRILELNPRHPVIKKLAQAVFDKKEPAKVEDAVWVLYDQARSIEGEPLKDPAGFARRINAFLENGL